MSRLLAFALVLLAAVPVEAAEKRLDRTFNVSPGGSLFVDADGASVEVTGNDGNQVVVHMVSRDSDDNLANTTLEAVQKANDVSVTMRRNKRSWFQWGSWNSEQSIEVSVPRRYTVNVHTAGGAIQLRDSEGAASLRTSGGSFSAENVTGNVELRTSGGSIHAETIRGDVNANTSGGDVRLLQVDGKIQGHTSGGSLRCSLVGANRGISATTSGGSIELTLPRATAGTVEATTSGGQVSSELPLSSTVREDSRLLGSLNGGGEPIYAHTSGGSISLRAAK
jgi:DUF4097 and DUF4098 domain-containing protein YvlB